MFGTIALVFLVCGCGGSFPKGAERLSSKDQAPRGARLIGPAKLGQELEGAVSSPLKDRTDHWYVNLLKDSTLTVLLQWSNTGARLQLSVLDPAGREMLHGLAMGSGGLRAVAAASVAGRYSIRVRAIREQDESSYTLKVRVKTCGARPGRAGCVCHDCKVGQRSCLGKKRTISCVQVKPGCRAWAAIKPCASGVACVDGACGSCHRCRSGARRCKGSKRSRVCVMGKDGCLDWGPAKLCTGRRNHCYRGKCVIKPPRPRCGDDRCDKPRETSANCPRDCKKVRRCVKGRIQTMYTYNGRMTMHILIGEGTPVRVGHKGYVLEGSSNARLPGGDLRITRVLGVRAVAVTGLERLGLNRFVCIIPR